MRPNASFRPFIARLRRFRHSSDGGLVSIELMLVLPIMIWAYLGMMIFFDAYRARTEAQNAALHVADLMSRQSQTMTTDYLEGLNDVFDFLTARTPESRLRVSLVVRTDADEPPVVAWSYGTRGLLPLDQVLALLSLDLTGTLDDALSPIVGLIESLTGGTQDGNNGNPLGGLTNGLLGQGGTVQTAASQTETLIGGLIDELSELVANGSGSFGNLSYHMPVSDLSARIDPVLPGEALIVVEAFTAWNSPSTGLLRMPFLNDTRLTPVAVTRPRFSPFINYEGAAVHFDPDLEELPPTWEIPDPEPTDPDPVDPDDTSLTSVVVDNDFTTNDTAGWSQTAVTHTNHATVGSFLGPFGRQTMQNPVTFSVNLGQESERARIEFDLLVIDSWDGFNPTWSRPEGENFVIQINGSSIAAEPFHHAPGGLFDADRRTVASRAEGRFTTSMVRTVAPQQMVGSGWADQVWRVTIDIDAPVQNFTLGFLATLDEDVNNESFGLMNIRISADHGARNPQHYIPPANTLLGIDPVLRFDVYQGCPEFQQAAPTHTLTQDHLWDPLVHRVRARGDRRLNTCGLPGIGSNPSNGSRIHATPTYILDWTDLNWRSGQHRLRIRTEDGNRGQTCDPSLLVRDPTGAWLFHEDISVSGGGQDWNARINLAWAPSGQYHIWVGHWNSGACDVDLIIERY